MLALGGCNAILGIEQHDIAQGGAGMSTAGSGAHAGGGSGGTAGAQTNGGSAGTGGSNVQAGEAGNPAGGASDGAVCGNGKIDGDDACDDGNAKLGDGCDARCEVEDGWTCDADGCAEICGDGLVVGAEAQAGGCDDDNPAPGDGCTNCLVDTSYSCSGQPSTCAKTCGNGQVEGAEGCDDGNTKMGDGCYACAVEPGYACDNSVDPSTCDDIDECASDLDDCDAHATCKNQLGGFKCTCNDGYTGTGQSCSDVNECSGTNDCDANAKCSNTPPGSFTCTCKPGFAGNGTTCTQNSCDGLTANCGKGKNEDCCSTKAVPGGSNFYRTYDGIDHTDMSFPATVSAFRLDRFEVTVSRFRKFVTAWRGGWRPAEGDGKHVHVNGGNGLQDTATTGTEYEKGWSPAWDAEITMSDYDISCGDSGTYAQPVWTTNPGTADDERRAMNCVSWYEAYAFCIWDGNGFLPSEAEWNFAASGGTDYRLYPWPNGTGLDCSKANFNPGSPCSTPLGPLVVGGTSTGGDAKWGQADMGGNVSEWVLDSYDPYGTPCNDCAPLEDDFQHMHRGGNYTVDAAGIESAMRYSGAIANNDTTMGVRCARP